MADDYALGIDDLPLKHGHPDSNSMHPTPSTEIMEQVLEKNLKTPPESDPRKVPAGSENSLGPEDFDDIRPKDYGMLNHIDEETPGLVGN
jgi:hypothetical protein